jgi:diguanylate cyclase
VVLYVFIVAIINVGLGYALAVHLGRRYELLAARKCLVGLQTFEAAHPSRPISGPEIADKEVPAPRADLATESDGTSPHDAAAAPGDSATAPGNRRNGPVSIANPPAEAPAEASPLPPHAGAPKSPGETAVGDFLDQVIRYDTHLSAADDKLRQCEEAPEAAAIAACLDSLWAATQEYLEHRDVAYRHLADLSGPHAASADIHDGLRLAMESQDAAIETAGRSIAAFHADADPTTGCRRMVEQTNRLMHAHHQMRDTLDLATAEVARREHRLDTPGAAAANDPLTGVCNRTGLEAAVLSWWQNDPQRARHLALVMLDIDQFAQVNEQIGCRAGDKVLQAIAQLLTAERPDEGTLARLAGQRFALFLPDTDIRSVTNLSERIRQTIEKVHFYCRGQDIRLTVSCAATEAAAEDTAATLLARAEDALREAKRYGRNRTFLYEGKYPTPVVPPNFSLEEKSITL